MFGGIVGHGVLRLAMLVLSIRVRGESLGLARIRSRPRDRKRDRSSPPFAPDQVPVGDSRVSHDARRQLTMISLLMRQHLTGNDAS